MFSELVTEINGIRQSDKIQIHSRSLLSMREKKEAGS